MAVYGADSAEHTVVRPVFVMEKPDVYLVGNQSQLGMKIAVEEEGGAGSRSRFIMMFASAEIECWCWST